MCMIFSLNCIAMNTGFATEDINKEDQAWIYQNLKVQSIQAPEITGSFCCFDVNPNGNYILGFNGKPDKVCVYDKEGIFLYGFSLQDNGSFGVGWDDGNILVYRVRSDLAVSIDRDGNCIDMKKIPQSIENNEYWNHVVRASNRVVGDEIFNAENHMGLLNIFSAQTYTSLVKTSASGDEIILFDATKQQKMNVIGVLLIIGVFLLVFIIGFSASMIRLNKTRTSE